MEDRAYFGFQFRRVRFYRREVEAAVSRQNGRRRELRVHTLSCKQETEGELEMMQCCKL